MNMSLPFWLRRRFGGPSHWTHGDRIRARLPRSRPNQILFQRRRIVRLHTERTPTIEAEDGYRYIILQGLRPKQSLFLDTTMPSGLLPNELVSLDVVIQALYEMLTTKGFTATGGMHAARSADQG